MATTAEREIDSIQPEHILQVYSGKPGCMCGCKGKYSVNPAHKAEADARRGYETGVGGGVAMVTKVLRLMREQGAVFDADDFAEIKNENRVYVLYPSAAGRRFLADHRARAVGGRAPDPLAMAALYLAVSDGNASETQRDDDGAPLFGCFSCGHEWSTGETVDG